MGATTSKGFTYLFVLILIATLGAVLSVAGTRWAVFDQRTRETELLRSGAMLRSAIGAYYESSPGTVKRYPPSLEALLRDERYLATRRYLRKIPADPMTREADWGLVSAPDGGIKGIYSRSNKPVFKTGNFSPVDSHLAKASVYSEWHFVYVSATPAGPVVGNPTH